MGKAAGLFCTGADGTTALHKQTFFDRKVYSI